MREIFLDNEENQAYEILTNFPCGFDPGRRATSVALAYFENNVSDLVESLRLVKNQHKKKIGLVIPQESHPSRELMKYADFVKRIRKGVLSRSQLPDPIPDTSLHKPSRLEIKNRPIQKKCFLTTDRGA